MTETVSVNLIKSVYINTMPYHRQKGLYNGRKCNDDYHINGAGGNKR